LNGLNEDQKETNNNRDREGGRDQLRTKPGKNGKSSLLKNKKRQGCLGKKEREGGNPQGTGRKPCTSGKKTNF